MGRKRPTGENSLLKTEPSFESHPPRRAVLKGAALSGLVFTIGGVARILTPAEAYAADLPLTVLAPNQKLTLEAVCEVLLPGATVAGIAHYIDHQLTGPIGDCLLFARIVDVALPYAAFYQAVLAAIDATATEQHGAPFAALAPQAKIALITAMRDGTLEKWQGPPGPFAFFVLRNDATDVVYGTVAGFDKLGVPYMPHIAPPTPW